MLEMTNKEIALELESRVNKKLGNMNGVRIEVHDDVANYNSVVIRCSSKDPIYYHDFKWGLVTDRSDLLEDKGMEFFVDEISGVFGEMYQS